MGTINSAIQLANIRSKIDAQQQIVSLLEVELQKTILGDNTVTIGQVFGEFGANPSPSGGVRPAGAATIDSILRGIAGPQGKNDYGNGNDLYDAMIQPFLENFDFSDNLSINDEVLDQTAIRQILYQARAMLGELRVEEQHWNQEVNEEKARRKDLAEFAKG